MIGAERWPGRVTEYVNSFKEIKNYGKRKRYVRVKSIISLKGPFKITHYTYISVCLTLSARCFFLTSNCFLACPAWGLYLNSTATFQRPFSTWPLHCDLKKCQGNQIVAYLSPVTPPLTTVNRIHTLTTEKEPQISVYILRARSLVAEEFYKLRILNVKQTLMVKNNIYYYNYFYLTIIIIVVITVIFKIYWNYKAVDLFRCWVRQTSHGESSSSSWQVVP